MKPKITEYNFHVKNLKRSLTIVQLSDLHLDEIRSGKWFEREVLKRLDRIKPDIVVITGDIYDGKDKIRKEILPWLQKLGKKWQVLVSVGNHEYYNGLKESIKIFEKAGWSVLFNECMEIENIVICGIEDLTVLKRSGKMFKMPQNFDKFIQTEKFKIILSHSPLFVKEFSDAGFDLILSGHTHDGQLFPFNLFVKLEYPYMAGLYKIAEGKYLIVSRGTGTWGPPVRLFTRSEIVVIRLIR